MRIHLKIIAKNLLIPFDHQPKLVGAIHKWLGFNEEHGKISLYSFSQLQKGKATANGILIEDGTSLFISSHSVEFLKNIVKGIKADPAIFSGLFVEEIVIEENPDLSGRNLFYPASPIFIKRKVDHGVEHVLYNDPRAGNLLKETLLLKMQVIGLFDEDLALRFDTSYLRASSKKLNYNGVQNRASWCPVFIEGKPETKLFAWNVGLGNSTGIGFGAIK